MPVSVGRIIKNSEQAEIIFLRERIVFVRVTLRARHRGTHPHRHRGIHAIDDRHVAKFFVNRAPFTIGGGVTVKGGGD